jgi:hypothetical protein
MIDGPAGGELACFDDLFPGALLGTGIMFRREEADRGRVGAGDVVAFGGVLGEEDGFVVQGFFPTPTIAVGVHVSCGQQDDQRDEDFLAFHDFWLRLTGENSFLSICDGTGFWVPLLRCSGSTVRHRQGKSSGKLGEFVGAKDRGGVALGRAKSWAFENF